MAIFIKPNHLVPLCSGGEYIEALDENNLELCGCIKDEISYELYQDDGLSKDYYDLEHRTIIKVSKEGEGLQVTCNQTRLSFTLNVH